MPISPPRLAARREERRGIVVSLARAALHILLGGRDLEKGKARIGAEFGCFDMRVNNAGIGLDFDPSLSSIEKMKRTLQLNVVGTLRATEAILPLLTASEDTRIVHLSSKLASFGQRHEPKRQYRKMLLPTYADSKAALNALTFRQLVALEGQRGKINAICPGFTD